MQTTSGLINFSGKKRLERFDLICFQGCKARRFLVRKWNNKKERTMLRRLVNCRIIIIIIIIIIKKLERVQHL